MVRVAPSAVNDAHKIDERTLNSNIEYCISEFVRLTRDREILRDKWFGGLTFKEIADKYGLTEQHVKTDILYKLGDPVLLRALKMSTDK